VEVLNAGGKFAENAEVVVAPTALHLGAVQSKLRPDIQVAVQNVWEKPTAGAWTGELTVDLIKDFGINWAIIGHSERRAYCGETPEKVRCVTCHV
jgi:triosephosphate isomerase